MAFPIVRELASTALLTRQASRMPSAAMISISTSIAGDISLCTVRLGMPSITKISPSAAGMNSPSTLRRASTMSRT